MVCVIVSIPIGFSSSMQPFENDPEHAIELEVSIPIGFSSSLQRQLQVLRWSKDEEFQSLSGFQARCNGSDWPRPP